MILSENIRAYRLKRGYTQEQLANLLGVSPQAVSRWETSDTMPDTALLPAIANTLETSIDALFGVVSNDRTSLYDAIERFVTAADSEEEQIKRIYELIVAGNKAARGDCETLAPDYAENRNTASEGKTAERIAASGQVSLFTPGAAVMTFESAVFPYAALIAPPSEGFCSLLDRTQPFVQLFQALGDPDVFRCIMQLLHKAPGEISLLTLIRQSGADESRYGEIAERLRKAPLSMLRISEIRIDNRIEEVISYSPRTPELLLLLFAAYACTIARYGFRSSLNLTDGPLL